MNKKKFLFSLIFPLFFVLPTFAYKEVSPFIESIYKRYYFIERLKRAVEFVKACSIDDQIIIEINLSMNHFKNNLIKESVKRMAVCKNLQPIVMTWEDFTSFKLLEDETYLDDFTKLILIISEKILLQILPRLYLQSGNEIQLACQKGLSASLFERLGYIDLINELLIMLRYKKIIKIPTITLDTIQTSYTESVTNRFYYVHRLQRAVKLIVKEKEKAHNYFYKIDAHRGILDEKITFSHEYIVQTIHAIEQTKNLSPLEKIWHEFEHYKFLEDYQLVKEFSKLIFILQKNKIINLAAQEKKANNTSLQKLMEIYNNLDSLPLEEILNAIDIMATELPKLNEKFELDSDMTWRQWFRKYWWAPPLIVSTIAVKSLLTLKNIKAVIDWLQKEKANQPVR